MSYLIRGKAAPEGILFLITTDQYGFLADGHNVGFRVLDPDDAQVFPVADGTYHAAKKLAKGHYHAFNAGTGAGWASEDDADLGAWTVEWRWRLTAGGDFKTWRFPFSLEDGDAGLKQTTYRTYVTPAGLREHGITIARLPDSQFVRWARLCEKWIEALTKGNLFRPAYRTIRVQGGGGNVLFLPLPLLALDKIAYTADSATSSLLVGDSIYAGVDIDPSYVRPVCSPMHESDPAGPIGPNAATNPRIHSSAFGCVEYDVTGWFGYLEADGSCPEAVRWASAEILYVRATSAGGAGGAAAGGQGPKTSERVDRHSVTWAGPGMNDRVMPTSTIATSRSVEETLAPYRRALRVG